MSKYFKVEEMACPCCGRVFVDDRLFPILDRIRDALGVPVYITSGYRCPSHNASVGGVANSQHLDGTAADITYDGVDVEKLTARKKCPNKCRRKARNQRNHRIAKHMVC